uniref:Uncharacterized protein n=1 Tax=Polytomella parva TaxID=51329 RepID=A0A6U0U6K4_9CHLO
MGRMAAAAAAAADEDLGGGGGQGSEGAADDRGEGGGEKEENAKGKDIRGYFGSIFGGRKLLGMDGKELRQKAVENPSKNIFLYCEGEGTDKSVVSRISSDVRDGGGGLDDVARSTTAATTVKTDQQQSANNHGSGIPVETSTFLPRPLSSKSSPSNTAQQKPSSSPHMSWALFHKLDAMSRAETQMGVRLWEKCCKGQETQKAIEAMASAAAERFRRRFLESSLAKIQLPTV